MLLLIPLVVGILGWRGCLRADALNEAEGEVGLRPADLLAGVGLYLLGNVAFLLIARALFEVNPSTGGLMSGGTLAQGTAMLLGQALSQGPPAAYFLFRFRAPAPGAAGHPLRGLWTADVGWGTLKGIAAAFPLMLGLQALGQLVRILVQGHAPALGHATLRDLAGSTSAAGTLLIVLAAVGVAPFLEELLFRGLLQTALRPVLNHHRWWLVIGSGLIFGAVHSSAAWQTLPALAVFGMMLGWLYEKHGRLWPPILVHLIFNAVNVAWVLGFYS